MKSNIQIAIIVIIITIMATNLPLYIYPSSSILAHIIATGIALFMDSDLFIAILLYHYRERLKIFNGLKSTEQAFVLAYVIVIPDTMILTSLGFSVLKVPGMIGVFLTCNIVIFITFILFIIAERLK